MKTYLSLFSAFFVFTTLFAQTYDISQYQARFERRPLLELNPRLNYSSTFSNRNGEDQHFGGASLRVDWSERFNQDDRIQNLSLTTQASFLRQEFEDSNMSDRSEKGVLIEASLEQYNYSTPSRFWGFRANALINAQDRNNAFQVSDRSTNINFQPGIFFGTGRIEFAEDALLANWMMDDLLEAGVIESGTPEERLALAQRITSIIGNRTFDFRRRRIYELQQLQQLFSEADIAVKDDFLLFAILNDNWAFANRATLPHGQRWTLGLDAGSNYFFISQPSPLDNFRLSTRPYVSYEWSTIRHNNAATILGATLSAFYQKNLDEGNAIVPVFSLRPETGAALNLAHTYVWLPISRTTLRWSNALNLQFDNFSPDDDIFTEDQWTIQGQSLLDWDYFVSYNWRLSLRVGIQYFNNNNQFIDNRTIRPFLNLSTRYAIF